MTGKGGLDRNRMRSSGHFAASPNNAAVTATVSVGGARHQMPSTYAPQLTDPEKSEAIRHDGLAFIGLTLIAFSIAVFYVAREGMTANSVIYLSGAIASIVIALLRMRFAPRPREALLQALRGSDELWDF